ncbi:MAG: M15 family metallopeptidase [Deltaproteobacteria bacterium]|nr:M15 family metallopeptidase [Deltaproteobacteria bacterium]
MPGEGEEDSPQLGEVTSAVSVGTYTTSGCSTSVVLGLSQQIAEEIGCMSPGALVRFQPSANLQITSSAVLPFLHSAAKTHLEQVAATKVVKVNSAFRTVAQQYLLYRWYQQGRCGITAAATPGRSNHESGRALDVSNYSSLISAMANKGWSHSVPGDPVHFDHLASPDIRGKDVLALQRLWNRNNPNDKIAEDGAYGPQTEARLKASPATGFAVGASCTTQAPMGSRTLMVEGPDKLAPGMRGHFAFTIANNNVSDWPASAKIVVADGAASPLRDPSWTSATEVGTIGNDIGAGAQGIIELDVTAPLVDEETPVFTQLAILGEDGTTEVGRIDLALTITPNGDEDHSSEADDAHDDGAEIVGGCSAGGGGAGWLAALAGIAVVLRRRRRS